jgi:hypothetical protein
MDRLSIILSLLSGALITGTLVITAFSIGDYDWWWIAFCAIAGFAMAWPSGYYISRLIKSQDKNRHRTPEDAPGRLPRPSDPEI